MKVNFHKSSFEIITLHSLGYKNIKFTPFIYIFTTLVHLCYNLKTMNFDEYKKSIKEVID